jgi:hypothetical protein
MKLALVVVALGGRTRVPYHARTRRRGDDPPAQVQTGQSIFSVQCGF